MINAVCCSHSDPILQQSSLPVLLYLPTWLFLNVDVGSWAEMSGSVSSSVFHCLWGHEITAKPEGPWCTALPRQGVFGSAVNVPFLSTYGESLCSHSDLHPSQ